MTVQNNKIDLLLQLQRHFTAELENLEKSAQAAAENATHTENKPEHKYDTRALEASYLAGAQKERALELRAALTLLQTMSMRVFTADDSIAVTALVEMTEGERTHHFLLMPVGAGYRLTLGDLEVTTITPQSPLGKSLLGKFVGDVIAIKTAQGTKESEILSII